MVLDGHNVLRGKCTLCIRDECIRYERPASGHLCEYCQHAPISHERLMTTPAPATASTSQPRPRPASAQPVPIEIEDDLPRPAIKLEPVKPYAASPLGASATFVNSQPLVQTAATPKQPPAAAWGRLHVPTSGSALSDLDEESEDHVLPPVASVGAVDSLLRDEPQVAATTPNGRGRELRAPKRVRETPAPPKHEVAKVPKLDECEFKFKGKQKVPAKMIPLLSKVFKRKTQRRPRNAALVEDGVPSKVDIQQWFTSRKVDSTTDSCAVCSATGSLLSCDGVECGKSMHRSCVPGLVNTSPDEHYAQAYRYLCSTCMHERAKEKCYAGPCAALTPGSELVFCNKCSLFKHLDCMRLPPGVAKPATLVAWFCETCFPEAWSMGSRNGTISKLLVNDFLAKPLPWTFEWAPNTKILAIGRPMKDNDGKVHFVGYRSEIKDHGSWYENEVLPNGSYRVTNAVMNRSWNETSPSRVWMSVYETTRSVRQSVSGPLQFRFSEHSTDVVSTLVRAVHAEFDLGRL